MAVAVAAGSSSSLDPTGLKEKANALRGLNRFFKQFPFYFYYFSSFFLKRNIITHTERERKRDGQKTRQTGFPPPIWRRCQPYYIAYTRHTLHTTQYTHTQTHVVQLSPKGIEANGVSLPYAATLGSVGFYHWCRAVHVCRRSLFCHQLKLFHRYTTTQVCVCVFQCGVFLNFTSSKRRKRTIVSSSDTRQFLDYFPVFIDQVIVSLSLLFLMKKKKR